MDFNKLVENFNRLFTFGGMQTDQMVKELLRESFSTQSSRVTIQIFLPPIRELLRIHSSALISLRVLS